VIADLDRVTAALAERGQVKTVVVSNLGRWGTAGERAAGQPTR
jgi:hypothetical protein